MNTSVLISYIEAELAQIDQAHRTLEVELVAYGIISRVLKNLYAQKKQSEAPVPAAEEPPSPNGYQMFKLPQSGKIIPVKFLPNRRMENGVAFQACLYCGKTFTPIRANTITCKGRACNKEHKKHYQRALYSHKRENIEATRRCASCGQGFQPRNRTQMVCGNTNRACNATVSAAYQSLSKFGKTGPAKTPGHSRALEMQQKITAAKEAHATV